jgi:hypothetical protein
MSRNGYEMDDETHDPDHSEGDDSSAESSITPSPSAAKPRARKSRAPKAAAAKTKGKGAGSRKSDGESARSAARSTQGAPKPRKSLAPQVDLSATVIIPPGRNPTAKMAKGGRASQHPDTISIPPADLNDHDERFFAEGEKLASVRGEHFEAFARLKAGSVSSPDLGERPAASIVPHERRKKLASYVKIAVGISAALCLAAVARVGLTSGDHGTVRSAAAAQITHAPITAIAHADPVAPAPAADSNAQPGHTFTEEAAPAIPLKSAHEEREDARSALEHGKAKDAVDAATRSVTVDPTDAEAWLLLGAAQQETGHPADAHSSFLECTKQAKTGNVGECRAMLQWNGPR